MYLADGSQRSRAPRFIVCYLYCFFFLLYCFSFSIVPIVSASASVDSMSPHSPIGAGCINFPGFPSSLISTFYFFPFPSPLYFLPFSFATCFFLHFLNFRLDLPLFPENTLYTHQSKNQKPTLKITIPAFFLNLSTHHSPQTKLFIAPLRTPITIPPANCWHITNSSHNQKLPTVVHGCTSQPLLHELPNSYSFTSIVKSFHIVFASSLPSFPRRRKPTLTIFAPWRPSTRSPPYPLTRFDYPTNRYLPNYTRRRYNTNSSKS